MEKRGQKHGKIRLYHFDSMARAEPIRMLLEHSGLQWQDVRCTKDEFEMIKCQSKLDFEYLPMLEMDGM